MTGPFARNHGFSELHDKTFNDDGYPIDTLGTTLLYDVRALYGFFLFLQNKETINLNFVVRYSYKDFTDLKTFDVDDTNEDWQLALDSVSNPISGILNNTNLELEFVRATSKITAVRIDLDSASNLTLDGVFSTV